MTQVVVATVYWEMEKTHRQLAPNISNAVALPQVVIMCCLTSSAVPYAVFDISCQPITVVGSSRACGAKRRTCGVEYLMHAESLSLGTVCPFTPL